MIRLLFLVLVRWFIIALVIYTVLTLLKKMFQSLQSHPHPPRSENRQEDHPKVKEEYKDVQDAKFVELPKKPGEDNKNSPV